MSQSSPSGGAESGTLPIPFGRHVVGQAGPGDGHLADRARLHQLGELGIELRRPPLRAHLHDPVVPPGRLDHPPAFADREREGLLDVDILARVARHDRLDGMPVVGRGDDHRVDVLLVEDAAEILVPLDRAAEFRQPRGDSVGQLLEMRMDLVELPVQIRLVDVAKGDDLGVLVSEERVEDLHAAVSDADAADAHPIVGPDHAARASGAGGRGRRRAREGRLGEVRRLKWLDMFKASAKAGRSRSASRESSKVGGFSDTIYPMTVENSRSVEGSR